MYAAPYSIPPCVRVGPSSIARTLFPRIWTVSSGVIGEAASTTTASGFASRTFRFTISTFSGVAVSTLLMTTTSAMRTFVSPG